MAKRVSIANEGRILHIDAASRPKTIGQDVEDLLLAAFPRIDEGFVKKLLNHASTNALLFVADKPLQVLGMFDVSYGRQHGKPLDSVLGFTGEDEFGEPANEETDSEEDNSDNSSGDDSDEGSSDSDSDSDGDGAEEKKEATQKEAEISCLTEASTDQEPASSVPDPSGLHVLGCLLYSWETQMWTDPASLYTSLTDPSLTPSVQESVAQVSLIAVKHRYRRRGVGTRLVRELLRSAQAKEAPAVIVNADPSGADFFRRLNFTDDPIMNLRYRSFPDFLSRSITLSRCISPRIAFPAHPRDKAPYTAAQDVSERLAAWKAARSAAFGIEMSMMESMATHIRDLRARLLHRESQLDHTLRHSAKLELENKRLHEQLLRYRELLLSKPEAEPLPAIPKESPHDKAVRQLFEPFGRVVPSTSTEFAVLQKEIVDGNHSSHGLSRLSLKALVALDHEANNTVVAQRFLSAEKERLSQFDASAGSSSIAPRDILSVRLFFGDSHERLHSFARCGFPKAHPAAQETKEKNAEGASSSMNDMLAEYGLGYYFSRYSSKAYHFSSCDALDTAAVFPSSTAISDIQQHLEPSLKRKLRLIRTDGRRLLQVPWRLLVVAKVMLGSVSSTVALNPRRKAPEDGFDSFITPGRRFPADVPFPKSAYSEDVSLRLASSAGEEFLVFDGAHILPLYLAWVEAEV